VNEESSKRINLIKKAKRVIVKLGSGTLACRYSGLDESFFESIAADVAAIRKMDIDVVLVSSGAVIAGMQKLGMQKRPKTLLDKQTAAAVGQTQLMWMYENSFSQYKQKVAQILLTHDDMVNRQRFINARHTLHSLLEWGVIPIINENDTVAVDEIKFGDNDELSSLVVNLTDSPLLIILSDVDGVFDINPKKNKNATFLPYIDDVSSLLSAGGLESDGMTGTGGMFSKLHASKTASTLGAATVIANGKTEWVLSKIMLGEEIGTFLAPQESRMVSRKHWIAYALKQKGVITADEGAVMAVSKNGKSLLPSGITAVSGEFNAGDMVSCVDVCGAEFARGITSFSSEDIIKIRGVRTEEIYSILGYTPCSEVIHRDDLTLMGDV